MNEDIKKFAVSFYVNEHDQREVALVTVDKSRLEDGVSAREKAVEHASNKSPYTHVETVKIEERELVT